MGNLTIGEVEKQTGCKAHTIRYWEQSIPLIQPKKDAQGYRLYSTRDVELIKRIKILVQERKFSIEGASEQLYREITGEQALESPSKAIITDKSPLVAVRSELERVLELIRNSERDTVQTKLPHGGKE